MQRRFLSSAKGPGDGSGLLVSARPTFVGWRRGRTSSQRVRLNHALMHATAEDLYFRTLTLPLSQQLHGRTGASGGCRHRLSGFSDDSELAVFVDDTRGANLLPTPVGR